MKDDSLMTKIMIFISSLLITALVIVMFVTDNNMEWGTSKIVFCIISSFWGFFLAPMLKYIVNWFISLSMEEAVYAGYKIGYYGIALLIILDPLIGYMYYFDKKLTTPRGGGRNIVMVGWYIV